MANAKLRQDLRNLQKDLDALISEVIAYAEAEHIFPTALRTTEGNFVLAPLLSAKAAILSALTNLEK